MSESPDARRETDEYSIEIWEEVALRLAERAGIVTPHHELISVAGRAVLLSRRFDRAGSARTPFLSAMSLTDSIDGEPGSYPEIVDEIARHGAQAKADSMALYRRMAFNVLVSNVDDHLRNHGFLRLGRNGWSLSPVYDLNPTPTDVKARILATRIDLTTRRALSTSCSAHPPTSGCRCGPPETSCGKSAAQYPTGAVRAQQQEQIATASWFFTCDDGEVPVVATLLRPVKVDLRARHCSTILIDYLTVDHLPGRQQWTRQSFFT